MLATPDRQKPYERDLHASQRSESEPSTVAYVQPRTVPSHADENEGVQW